MDHRNSHMRLNSSLFYFFRLDFSFKFNSIILDFSRNVLSHERADLSRVNGISCCSAKIWDFNSLPKFQLFSVAFKCCVCVLITLWSSPTLQSLLRIRSAIWWWHIRVPWFWICYCCFCLKFFNSCTAHTITHGPIFTHTSSIDAVWQKVKLKMKLKWWNLEIWRCFTLKTQCSE